MKLRTAGEDYLEAVLILQKKLGMVRSVDIATMEACLKKMETREQKYSVELDKALTEYAELKAQSADFD